MAADERFGQPISDIGALRALAHAGRYAMLEHLQEQGPATATECAAITGLSPSACSYHLRLLARHGFVARDEAGSEDGRERRWRAVVTNWRSDPDAADDPAEGKALDATLGRVMLASSQEKVLAWLDAGSREPEWQRAALFSNATIVVTVDELAAVGAAVMEVLAPYLHTTRPLDVAPEGARQVHAALRFAPRTG
jgi:DNA-binding transcriptional ArsR family regulator